MIGFIVVVGALFIVAPLFLTACAAYAFGLRDRRVVMITFCLMVWGMWTVVQGPTRPVPQAAATSPAR